MMRSRLAWAIEHPFSQNKKKNEKKMTWASRMVQWLRVPAIKPDNTHPIPGNLRGMSVVCECGWNNGMVACLCGTRCEDENIWIR